MKVTPACITFESDTGLYFVDARAGTSHADATANTSATDATLGADGNTDSGAVICGGITCDTNAGCDDSNGSLTCVCNGGYVGNGVSCAPAEISGALSTEDPGSWSDGTNASSCQGYQFPAAPYKAATSNGYYAIDPINSGTPVTVYCDMTTDGGGWTCIDPVTATSTFAPVITNLDSESNCGVTDGMPQAHKTGTLSCRFDFDVGLTFNELRASGLVIEAVTDGTHVSDLSLVDKDWGQTYCDSPASGDVVFGTPADTQGRLSLARSQDINDACNAALNYDNDEQIELVGSAGVARDHILRLEFGETGGQDEGWRWASGMICMRNGVELSGELTEEQPGVFEDQSVAQSCNEYRNPSGGLRVYAGSTGDGIYTIDSDGDGANTPYNVYCDMTTDGGGWTLLGTISGAGSDYWDGAELTPYDLWTNTESWGNTTQPWNDFKSRAWVELDVSSATIMLQRRYDGNVRAQTAIGNTCLDGKTRFNTLFTADIDYDTETYPSPTPCPISEITTITPAADTTGLASANYQEGSGTSALGGTDTNGWCWKGGDNVSNTFLGRAGWNQVSYDCVGAGHLGYIGVFENSSEQYDNSDITTTNWLYGTDPTLTDISFFAR